MKRKVKDYLVGKLLPEHNNLKEENKKLIDKIEKLTTDIELIIEGDKMALDYWKSVVSLKNKIGYKIFDRFNPTSL